MREAITRLETLSRQLEPSASQRQALNQEVMQYADRFLNALPEMPVYVEGKPAADFGSYFGEEPVELTTLLSELALQVDTPGINPASGGHLGYIPGGGIYYSALGDYLADVCNRYSGIRFASPGAAQLENQLVAWLARLIGYGPGYGGDLTSGGSIANLSAVVAAREAHDISAAATTRACVYITSMAHHCVTKALGIAGLKECVLRMVPMDALYRMDTTALAELVKADQDAGLLPWLVVASAGTTDTGSVDPLADIAQLCADNHLWFHIDAAYGGSFLLCESGKELMRGIEQADSIAIDQHKGLFLPYGSGAVIVKDRNTLARAHAYHANYMQDASAVEDNPSPASLSPELTRPFRGLRFWLAIKLAGIKPLRAALDEKLLLAQYFHQQISKMPDFEVGPLPQLSVVIYRYLPQDEALAAEINRRLVERIQREGRIFISSTLIDGQYMLRLAVLNFRTHLEHIDQLLEMLPRIAIEIEQSL